MVRAADAVVSIGCGDACPVFLGKRYEDWTADDPAGRPAKRLKRCAQSATKSSDASARCSTNSASPPPPFRLRRLRSRPSGPPASRCAAVEADHEMRRLPAGAALTVGIGWIWLALLGLLGLLWGKTWLEERKLAARFPSYGDSAARTPRLVPDPRRCLTRRRTGRS